MAVKNNVDVSYFATIVPTHVYFAEDGQMEKKVFLATWKDIPAQNEIQFTIEGTNCNSGKSRFLFLLSLKIRKLGGKFKIIISKRKSFGHMQTSAQNEI